MGDEDLETPIGDLAMEWIAEWMEANTALLATLGILSAVTFFVSLLVLPVIILLLPANYFDRPTSLPVGASPLRMVLHILKNVLGLCLLLLGVLMLFLPGQGILGMLLGCSLMDFPGKRRLQIRLLRGPRIRRTVNWIREKGGRAPLHIPEEIRAPE